MAVLSEEQIEFFNSNGYLVIEDVVDRERILAPLVDEYEDLLGGLVSGWVAEGRLEASVADQSFGDKLVSAYGAGCKFFQPMAALCRYPGRYADAYRAGGFRSSDLRGAA